MTDHMGHHATTVTAPPQTTSPLRMPSSFTRRPVEQTSSTIAVPAAATKPRPIKLQQTTTAAVAVETYGTTVADNTVATDGLPSYARPGFSRPPNNAFVTPQALGKSVEIDFWTHFKCNFFQ